MMNKPPDPECLGDIACSYGSYCSNGCPVTALDRIENPTEE